MRESGNAASKQARVAVPFRRAICANRFVPRSGRTGSWERVVGLDVGVTRDAQRHEPANEARSVGPGIGGRSRTTAARLRVAGPRSEVFLLNPAQSRAGLQRRSQFLLALKYFEVGELSSGQAAQRCGLSRPAPLLEAGRYGVAVAELDQDELEAEFAHTWPARWDGRSRLSPWTNPHRRMLAPGEGVVGLIPTLPPTPPPDTPAIGPQTGPRPGGRGSREAGGGSARPLRRCGLRFP